MTKSELRQSFVDLGWTVQVVANWALVSNVEGVVKYDANYVNPDGQFGTAQVVVTDDGGSGETAVAKGAFVAAETSFSEAVRAYTRGLENAQRFAIAVTEVFEADEIALATAYKSDGTSEDYVIKRRADTFTPLALA